MAWIDSVPIGGWDDDLRDAVADPGNGRIDHIMSVHSLNPRAMAAHQSLYESAMAGTSSFRKVDRELVAFVVSQLNDCHY